MGLALLPVGPFPAAWEVGHGASPGQVQAGAFLHDWWGSAMSSTCRVLSAICKVVALNLYLANLPSEKACENAVTRACWLMCRCTETSSKLFHPVLMLWGQWGHPLHCEESLRVPPITSLCSAHWVNPMLNRTVTLPWKASCLALPWPTQGFISPSTSCWSE